MFLSFLFNIEECHDKGAICELSEEQQQQQQKRLNRFKQLLNWLYWFFV